MRTRSALALVWLSAASVSSSAFADGAKAPPAPLSAADKKAYDAALAKGRAAEAKQDYAGALAAFQACVAVAPDDSTALGELGWVAYLTKDLPRAEAATRKALASQSAPNVRGAALYNLGLVEEAKHDRVAAIAAYRESLGVRPNGIVRAALAKLDTAAAAAFEPYKPVALAGPFPTVAAYCATLPKQIQGDDCTCQQVDSSKASRALSAPILQVEAITHTCGMHVTESGLIEYGYAIKTAAGWFAATTASIDQNRWCNDSDTLADVKMQDVAASAGAEAILTFAIAGDCSSDNSMSKWTEQAIVIASGGAKPAATPLVVVKKRELDGNGGWSSEPTRVTTDIALDYTWTPAGAFVVSGKTVGLDKGTSTDWLGKHTLVFP